MLSKSKFPMLNRQQRRHFKRFAETLVDKGWAGGGNVLLFKLLGRGGFHHGQTPA